MIFKRKPKQKISVQKKATVFDLPIGDSRVIFQNIISDVYAITESDTFIELTTKVKVPKVETYAELKSFVKQFSSKKIKALLELVFNEKFDNIINILSAVFMEKPEEYKKKTIAQIVEDLRNLQPSEMESFTGFFTQAHK